MMTRHEVAQNLLASQMERGGEWKKIMFNRIDSRLTTGAFSIFSFGDDVAKVSWEDKFILYDIAYNNGI